MREKFYKVQEVLDGHGAKDYLERLTAVSLSRLDFTSLIMNGLPCYVAIPCNVKTKNGETVCPAGLQQVKNPWATDFQWDAAGGYPTLEYQPYYCPVDGAPKAKARDIELFGIISEGGQPKDWVLTSEEYIQAGDRFETDIVLFNPRDIEALAAKMNNEPDAQALQEENQRLKQEIETLKAEVERLAKEAAAAQAEPQKSALLLIARALELYQRGNTQRYTQARFTQEVLDGQNIHGLGETTINNLLSKAKKTIGEARNT